MQPTTPPDDHAQALIVSCCPLAIYVLCNLTGHLAAQVLIVSYCFLIIRPVQPYCLRCSPSSHHIVLLPHHTSCATLLFLMQPKSSSYRAASPSHVLCNHPVFYAAHHPLTTREFIAPQSSLQARGDKSSATPSNNPQPERDLSQASPLHLSAAPSLAASSSLGRERQLTPHSPPCHSLLPPRYSAGPVGVSSKHEQAARTHSSGTPTSTAAPPYSRNCYLSAPQSPCSSSSTSRSSVPAAHASRQRQHSLAERMTATGAGGADSAAAAATGLQSGSLVSADCGHASSSHTHPPTNSETSLPCEKETPRLRSFYSGSGRMTGSGPLPSASVLQSYAQGYGNSGVGGGAGTDMQLQDKCLNSMIRLPSGKPSAARRTGGHCFQ